MMQVPRSRDGSLWDIFAEISIMLIIDGFSSLPLVYYFFEEIMALYYFTNHLKSPSALFQSVKKNHLHTHDTDYIEDIFLG